jgi:hypothetical protein
VLVCLTVVWVKIVVLVPDCSRRLVDLQPTYLTETNDSLICNAATTNCFTDNSITSFEALDASIKSQEVLRIPIAESYRIVAKPLIVGFSDGAKVGSKVGRLEVGLLEGI